MTRKFECPGCGNVWLKKSGLLGVRREGYAKVSDRSGMCDRCRYVQTF